ncbi:MAG TPA: hypothetical protein VKR32_04895 [Puia sp.]|nr:hypothetical protein [Puia sp.]
MREGLVRRSGKTQRVRYHYHQKEGSVKEKDNRPSETPISLRSRDVLDIVTRPIKARKPVGYNRNFLDSYGPNSSSYLSKAELERLAAAGPIDLMEDQPAGKNTRGKESLAFGKNFVYTHPINSVVEDFSYPIHLMAAPLH